MNDDFSHEVQSIYVVEDHDVIREGVKQYLELSGFKVQGFATLKAAREGFLRMTPPCSSRMSCSVMVMGSLL